MKKQVISISFHFGPENALGSFADRCQSVNTESTFSVSRQPRSQGPFSTSRKYFLELERGPWERGCVSRVSRECLASVSHENVVA